MLACTGCAAVQDMQYSCSNYCRAFMAWQTQSKKFNGRHSADYATGWKKGYFSVAMGGPGCPPAIPPERYWRSKYQSLEGQRAIEAWYRGFEDGSLASERDGTNNWHEVPTYAHGTVAIGGVDTLMPRSARLPMGGGINIAPAPAGESVPADPMWSQQALSNTSLWSGPPLPAEADDANPPRRAIATTNVPKPKSADRPTEAVAAKQQAVGAIAATANNVDAAKTDPVKAATAQALAEATSRNTTTAVTDKAAQPAATMRLLADGAPRLAATQAESSAANDGSTTDSTNSGDQSVERVAKRETFGPVNPLRRGSNQGILR
jgi:hypothetical protein